MHPDGSFFLKTAADFTAFNHKASWRLIKKLEKKGYDVFYDRIIAMGSNWFIEYNDGFVKQLYKAATEKTVHMADELIAGTRRRYRFSGFAAAMVSILSFCEEKIGARIFGITLHADKTCTKCGLCAKKCPVSNIKMNDHPSFGSNCLMCMRCVYNCPVNAVKSRGMGFCILSGGYNIRRIIKDSSLDDSFVNDKTSGYFKHFYQYLVDRSM